MSWRGQPWTSEEKEKEVEKRVRKSVRTIAFVEHEIELLEPKKMFFKSF